MSSGLNREIHLAARPQGWPTLDTFALVETPIPEPTEGQVLVRNVFMSVDPYMRGRMNAARSYAPPYEVGQVLYGGAVGQVVASRPPAFAVGDIVLSNNGWREYFVADSGLERIAPVAPLSYYLGVLGMPGLTAYVGLLDIGQPKEGETVFVALASGAVGSVVGQLARLKGCRAIGSAGSDEKVRLLRDELGFDAAFNYKETPPEQALRQGERVHRHTDLARTGAAGLHGWIARLTPSPTRACRGAHRQRALAEAQDAGRVRFRLPTLGVGGDPVESLLDGPRHAD